MSYTAEYIRPYAGGWQNTPSKETPVMAENLNNYDTAIIRIESYLSEAINNDFAQLSEAGYSLGLEIDHSTYVMTISLKNKAGKVISDKSIDFPIESMIIHAEYNESTKFITMTLQNGQTLDVNISAIVSGLVPDTRTIAGFELKNDITSEELKNALAVPSKVSELDNDLGYITSEDVKSDDSVVAIGEIKNWLYDTSGEEIVVGVYNGKPLYRKSFYYENYALSEEYNYFNFDVDVEKIVDVKAFMENSSHTNIRPINTYPFEEGSSPANALYYIIELDQKRIRICTNTAWSSPNIYFTLEYTKTTDAEGSGNRLTPYGFVRKDFANTSEYDMQKSYYGGLSIEKICGAVEQNGLPAPDSPVEIQNVDFTEVKSVGKNLLDLSLYGDRTNQGVTATIKNQTMTLNGTATDAGALPSVFTEKFPIKAKVGDTLTISTTILSGSATIAENTSLSHCVIRVDKEEVTRFAVKSKSGKIDKNTKITSESIVVTEDMISDDGFIYHTTQVYIRANDVYNNLVLGIQIELNTEATEWKPYKSSTAKIAFTGRAVEVSESDAYTYEKDGKYYVADTIEKTESGYQLVQRIGVMVFDGSSDENWYRTSTNGDIYSTKNLDQVNGIPKGLCSHFAYVGKSSTVIGSLAITEANCRPYFFFAEYGTTTVDDWASWLDANNITYHYILAEPIITELSDADKIQLLSLKTFEEVTHLSTDSVIKPIITSEYGISKTGGYTLESLQTAKRNDLRINALENLAIE